MPCYIQLWGAEDRTQGLVHTYRPAVYKLSYNPRPMFICGKYIRTSKKTIEITNLLFGKLLILKSEVKICLRHGFTLLQSGLKPLAILLPPALQGWNYRMSLYAGHSFVVSRIEPGAMCPLSKWAMASAPEAKLSLITHLHLEPPNVNHLVTNKGLRRGHCRLKWNLPWDIINLRVSLQ